MTISPSGEEAGLPSISYLQGMDRPSAARSDGRGSCDLLSSPLDAPLFGGRVQAPHDGAVVLERRHQHEKSHLEGMERRAGLLTGMHGSRESQSVTVLDVSCVQRGVSRHTHGYI